MRSDGFQKAPTARHDGNTTTSESFKGRDPERFFPPRWHNKKMLLIQSLRDRWRSEGTRELHLVIEAPGYNHSVEVRPFLATSDNCRARRESLGAQLDDCVQKCVAALVGYETA